MKFNITYDLLELQYLLLPETFMLKNKIKLQKIYISLNIFWSWYSSNSFCALKYNTKLVWKGERFRCVGWCRSGTFNCLQAVDKDQRYTRGNDVAVIHYSFVIPSPFFTLSPYVESYHFLFSMYEDQNILHMKGF